MGTREVQSSVLEGDDVCLICLQLYVDEKENPLAVDCLKNFQYVFSKVAKFLSSEVFGSYLQWNFVEEGSSPICPVCFSFVEKIFKLNEMIEKLQDKIQDLVQTFTNEVLGRHSKLQHMYSNGNIDSEDLVENLNTVTEYQTSDVSNVTIKEEFHLKAMTLLTNITSIDDENENVRTSPYGVEDLEENNHYSDGEESSTGSDNFTQDSTALAQTENNSNESNKMQLKEAIITVPTLSTSSGSKNYLCRNADIPLKELRIVLTRLNLDVRADITGNEGRDGRPKRKAAVMANDALKNIDTEKSDYPSRSTQKGFDRTESDYDPSSDDDQNSEKDNEFNQVSKPLVGVQTWKRDFKMMKRFKCDTAICKFECNFSKELEAHSVQLDHKNMKKHVCPEEKCAKKFFRQTDLDRHTTFQCTSKRTIKCASCPKRFKRQDNLVIHENRHHPARLHSCINCQKTFRRKINWIHHQHVHSKRYYRCKMCNKIFIWSCSLKLHTLSEHNNIKFECKACDRSFSKRKHLIRHNATHLKSKVGKVFPCAACNGEHFVEKIWDKCIIKHFREDKSVGLVCAVCGEVFKNSEQLDEHVVARGHINKKNFYCNLCQRGFYTIFTWQKHKCQQSLPELCDEFLQCRLCPKIFLSDKINPHTEWHINPDKCKCTVCGHQYRWMDNLRRHMQKSHNRKCEKGGVIRQQSFSCDVCYSQFYNALTLQAHHCEKSLNEDKINTEKFLTCKICSKTFKTKAKLKKHTEWHVNPDKFKCSMCNRQYKSLTYMKNHKLDCAKRSKNKRPVYVSCKICNKPVRRRTLSTHLLIHSTEEFKCTQCDASFNIQRKLKRHEISAHSSAQPFKCTLCDMKFKFKGHLSRHMKLHTTSTILCDVCGQDFTSDEYLNSHMKKHQEPLFPCTICDLKFHYKPKLDDHINSKHTNKESYSCQECSKSYFSKFNLRQHVFQNHSKKSFRCDVCNQSFRNKMNLNVHNERKHSEKKLKCDYCDKHFSTKYVLTDHVKGVHSEKTLQCEFCPYSCRLKHHLTIHINAQHHKQRPFMCDTCGNSFTRKHVLDIHIKNVHKERENTEGKDENHPIDSDNE